MTGQSKDTGPEILPTQDWEELLDRYALAPG